MSDKFTAESIGHHEIADFRRLSWLSRLNSGPKCPAQEADRQIFNDDVTVNSLLRIFPSWLKGIEGHGARTNGGEGGGGLKTMGSANIFDEFEKSFVKTPAYCDRTDIEY